MKMKGVLYRVESKWAPDPELPEAIGSRFVAFLDRLGPLNPAMANWLWGDGGRAIQLAKVRPNIAHFVERNVAIDNGEPDPHDGYNLFARGGLVEGERGSSRSVDIHVHAGSRWNNEVSFDIGSLLSFPEPDLTTYPIYRGALKAMAASFACPYVWARYCISTETIWIPNPDGEGGATAAPGEPTGPFDGVWIGYLSAPLAEGLTPPPDLFLERTPGGGLILSAVKDRIDPTNPDHVKCSRKLEAVMAKQAARPNHRGVVYPGDFPPRVGPY